MLSYHGAAGNNLVALSVEQQYWRKELRRNIKFLQ